MSKAILVGMAGGKALRGADSLSGRVPFVEPDTAGVRVRTAMLPFVPLTLFWCAQQSTVKIQSAPLQSKCLAFT